MLFIFIFTFYADRYLQFVMLAAHSQTAAAVFCLPAVVLLFVSLHYCFLFIYFSTFYGA